MLKILLYYKKRADFLSNFRFVREPWFYISTVRIQACVLDALVSYTSEAEASISY